MDEHARADAVRLRADELRRRGAAMVHDGPDSGAAALVLTALDQVEARYHEWVTRRESAGDDETVARNVRAALSNYAVVVRSGMRRIDELGRDARAKELTEALAGAGISGEFAVRNVGGYRALEFVPQDPGSYWTSADLVDEEGSGYLRINVARSPDRPPPVVTKPLPGPATRTQARTLDGVVVHSSVRSSGEDAEPVIEYRVVAVRPGGTYVDIQCVNQDSKSASITRALPPIAVDALVEIATRPDLVP